MKKKREKKPNEKWSEKYFGSACFTLTHTHTHIHTVMQCAHMGIHILPLSLSHTHARTHAHTHAHTHTFNAFCLSCASLWLSASKVRILLCSSAAMSMQLVNKWVRALAVPFCWWRVTEPIKIWIQETTTTTKVHLLHFLNLILLERNDRTGCTRRDDCSSLLVLQASPARY